MKWYYIEGNILFTSCMIKKITNKNFQMHFISKKWPDLAQKSHFDRFGPFLWHKIASTQAEKATKKL